MSARNNRRPAKVKKESIIEGWTGTNLDLSQLLRSLQTVAGRCKNNQNQLAHIWEVGEWIYEEIESSGRAGPASIFHAAVIVDDCDTLKKFRNYTLCVASAFRKDGVGSPLFLASIFGAINAADWLIKNGFDVNQCNKIGKAALHLAAATGSAEMVALLLKAGADAAIVDQLGKSPEEYAVDEATKRVFGDSRTNQVASELHESTWMPDADRKAVRL